MKHLFFLMLLTFHISCTYTSQLSRSASDHDRLYNKIAIESQRGVSQIFFLNDSSVLVSKIEFKSDTLVWAGISHGQYGLIPVSGIRKIVTISRRQGFIDGAVVGLSAGIILAILVAQNAGGDDDCYDCANDPMSKETVAAIGIGIFGPTGLLLGGVAGAMTGSHNEYIFTY